MKAIRVHEFGDESVLKYETVADPEPGTGQVLVRVRAVGVNPVDTYIRSGTYAVRPELPYVPGFDGAGEIVELGADVERTDTLKPGGRVYFGGTLTGAYAELALCEPGRLYPLPERSSFAEGACIAVPYGTSYRALFDRAGARAGESVLVHGASGGVGTAAVQLARALGMRVYGTAGTAEGLELVRKEGAHHALDHTKEGALDELMSLTGGRGVDVVLEMLANVNLGRDLTVLAPGGRVVVIGSRGTVEINPRDIMAREASVTGMVLLSASESELQAVHAGIHAGIEAGTLRPIVAGERPLAEAAGVHRDVMAPGARGNLVLVTDA